MMMKNLASPLAVGLLAIVSVSACADDPVAPVSAKLTEPVSPKLTEAVEHVVARTSAQQLTVASCAPSTAPFAAHTITCEWQYTGDKTYIATGIEVNGRVIHRLHWFVTLRQAQTVQAALKDGSECWITGATDSSQANNWHRNNWCQLHLDGDVAWATRSSGWPYCPHVDGTSTIYEHRSNSRRILLRKASPRGSRGQLVNYLNLCGLTPQLAPLMDQTALYAWATDHGATNVSVPNTQHTVSFGGTTYTRQFQFTAPACILRNTGGCRPNTVVSADCPEGYKAKHISGDVRRYDRDREMRCTFSGT